ncbi:MAG: phosphoglucosamine mutase [candidate division Zixibacteria bacterium]|nr:phosphoglucosamine mutase [candidate division Zixibacteria bacterium]
MGKLLVSISGIRGIVGDSLTSETAMQYGKAFGKYLKGGKVIIGRDTRYHGPMVLSAVAAGLMCSGCNVVDIGVATTPAIEFTVRETQSAGGIAITASHNPIEYNALKLIGPGGTFLTETQGKKFLKCCNSKQKSKKTEKPNIGSYFNQDDWDLKHIKAILGIDIIKLASIKRKKFRVVGDCVNGTASPVAAELFNSLGCTLKLINAVPDGKFPHPPEPVPANLKQLCRAVKSFKADIGFAFDPDSDRMAMVDENGKTIGEEYTLALGMRFILSKKSGPVAVNLSSSMMNDFVAKEASVKLYRTKVGEINVTEKLKRINGVAGGEGNGGLIYPDMMYGRDGLMAAAVMLQYLASSRKTISELASELPKTTMIKRKIALDGKKISFNKVIRAFKDGKADKRDGIKIIFDDCWLQLRLSNTEPIVRLMTEAYSVKKARLLADEVEKLLL